MSDDKLVLIGRGEQKSPKPTTAGQPFNWHDRLEPDSPTPTPTPGPRVGTGKMRSTLEDGHKLHVTEAAFILDDEHNSEVHAAGRVDFPGGKVGTGSLKIHGRGTGVFANSGGEITVERVNPKRYTIPLTGGPNPSS